MRRITRLSLYLLVVTSLFGAPACSPRLEEQSGRTGVTVFEGARLITGDGSGPIENSAFIVENNQFNAVGRKGELPVPAGATRVDLTGKTVMPAKVDMHGHPGVLLLLPADTPGTVRALVVEPNCSSAHTGLLANTLVTRP